MFSNLQMLCESLPSGAVITNRQGQIIAANTAFSTLLGYPINELRLRKMRDITFRENYEEHADSIQPLLVEGHSSMLELEKRFIRKNKSLIWLHVSLRMVLDEVSGNWYGVFLTLDLTERKWAEQEFRKYMQIRELLFTDIDQRATANQLLLNQLIQEHFSQLPSRFRTAG